METNLDSQVNEQTFKISVDYVRELWKADVFAQGTGLGVTAANIARLYVVEITDSSTNSFLYRVSAAPFSVPVVVQSVAVTSESENKSAFWTALKFWSGNGDQPQHVQKRSTKKSVIVKCAPSFARRFGEDSILSPDRIVFEHRALVLVQRLVPQMAPVPLAFSLYHSALAMEDLPNFDVLRTCLNEGRMDADHARQIATYLGTLHSKTWLSSKSQQEQEHDLNQFANDDMCIFLLEHFFTEPLAGVDVSHFLHGTEAYGQALRQDISVSHAIRLLREKFATKKECVIHGDLHTGSILVFFGDKHNKSQVKVIDWEFAMCGPAGADLGFLLGNWLFSFLRHRHSIEHRQILREAMYFLWEDYATSFKLVLVETEQINPVKVLQGIFIDAVEFMACELVHRVLGSSPVSDIETIPNSEDRLFVEIACLSIASAILRRGGSSMPDIATLLELVEHFE